MTEQGVVNDEGKAQNEGISNIEQGMSNDEVPEQRNRRTDEQGVVNDEGKAQKSISVHRLRRFTQIIPDN